MNKLAFFILLLMVRAHGASAQFNTVPENLERKGKWVGGASLHYYDDDLTTQYSPEWYRSLSLHVRGGRYVSNRFVLGMASWLIYQFPDRNRNSMATIIGPYATYNFLFLQFLPMYAESGLHYSNYCFREFEITNDKSLFAQAGLGLNPKIGQKQRWGLDIAFHQYFTLSCNDCTQGLLFYRIGIDWIF
ncbi:MAG: hypothetical protein JJT94_17410 [Bernardetiaceae bacterium]|nr:hypothetical protein [Bernardetiaceae bacterium]